MKMAVSNRLTGKAMILLLSLLSTEAQVTMKAVVGLGSAPEGDWSEVSYEEAWPTPSPKEDHALIKVIASSVNPVDWKILSGSNPPLYPKVLGFDVAGTLVGNECAPRLNDGDAVWADVGNSDWGEGEYAQLGAYAEYVSALCNQVSLRPQSINASEAAVLPLVGLTSYEALVMTGAPWGDGRYDPKADMVLVVTSGSGGTGHVGLQMAKNWAQVGTVVTACGPSNLAFCASMGADVVVDYTLEDVFDGLEDNSVDVVYDNYGAPGTADKALPKLRSGGVFIFLPGKGGALSNATKDGVTQINYGLADSSNHTTLDALAGMVDEGMLRGHVQQDFTLATVIDAFGASFAGNVTGKLGVRVA
mmetsp:Transcript_18140/g.37231  ORF Transcript_18140/g.37231 Transcript_18140/m.37231 type:complete len:361 (+) Transcript_18140:690-1772(+)